MVGNAAPKKVPPLFWLMVALAFVAVMPSAKAPTTAQAVISNPNPDPVLWSGSGSPPGSTGDPGDFWINRDAPMAIYGPKAAPATWPGPFSMVGPAGATGATGSTGATGPAGPSIVGYPTTRTLSLATAYQATDNTKPAVVTINISSTATLSLSGGTTNTADVVVGSTNAVAGGTGTAICKYVNTNTGTLTVGLNVSTVSASTCTFALPVGGYFAIRQTAGTVTISSAFDASVG